MKRLDALEALKKAIKTNDASPVRDALDKARDAKVPETNPTVKEAEDLLTSRCVGSAKKAIKTNDAILS